MQSCKSPNEARSSRRSQRGSSTVEFAIVMAVALPIVFGIIECGRALYTYHLVTNAARLGTRYAIVRGSSCGAPGCPAAPSDIQTYLRSVSPGIDQNAMTVATTWSGTASCASAPYQGAGCLVTVQVQYPFQFLTPYLPSTTLNLTSTSQMIISQ
ncbi:pilus assembly protein [bacterium]|nr:MAG: pilus assembly protein [bacterium]